MDIRQLYFTFSTFIKISFSGISRFGAMGTNDEKRKAMVKQQPRCHKSPCGPPHNDSLHTKLYFVCGLHVNICASHF